MTRVSFLSCLVSYGVNVAFMPLEKETSVIKNASYPYYEKKARARNRRLEEVLADDSRS